MAWSANCRNGCKLGNAPASCRQAPGEGRMGPIGRGPSAICRSVLRLRHLCEQLSLLPVTDPILARNPSNPASKRGFRSGRLVRRLPELQIVQFLAAVNRTGIPPDVLDASL